ncbi:esterase family protein [Apiospora aurea]|uniref:Esterase family protein n=1 Tax=Apiospora aurea TaxID=335848 RepID=A0ABR1Q651_9PEZI
MFNKQETIPDGAPIPFAGSMAIISRSWVNVLTVCSLLSTAVSSTNQVETIKHLLGWDPFEWTALGDSYSSGVGADTYTSNSYRCLRYDHAYPVLMNSDGRLPKGYHQFNNVVCSGASSKEIEDYQLYDENTFAEPSFQYGKRPKFGSPTMATLSIGGNDIDFAGIIFNCILETHIWGGPPPRSCEEQKEITWRLLLNPDLADNISRTIKKVVDKGRQGPIGDKFRLYVTGFPQFFNDDTTECDSVTFARTANPIPDGMDHVKLTREVRKDYNNMSVKLNQEIEKAVKMHERDGVRWIPIDPVMKGHRYCEPGVKEPDQHNDKLWLFHYPYDEPDDDRVTEHLEKGASSVALGKRQTYADYENQVFDALELSGDLIQKTAFDFFWREVGNRMKVFHPQIPLHEKIRDLVLDAYAEDLKGKGGGPSMGPPIPYENECPGTSGDTWMMSRDQAVGNAKAFCGQTQSKVKYNEGSVNELELSGTNDGSGKSSPKDAPDCEARFTDRCDGDDNTESPHNYKFGSTLTTGDDGKHVIAQDFDDGRN